MDTYLPPPRYRLLGAHVNAMTVEQLYESIAWAVRERRRCIIGNHNLHSIYLCQSEGPMSRFDREADLAFIDGVPVIWAGKLLRLPVNRSHRMTSVDWLVPFLRIASREQWTVFFLGSAPGVAERAIEKFQREAPGLRAGHHSGFFDKTPGSAENEAVLEKIRASGAEILLVGMGMPLQEEWILANRDHLDTPVIMNLGAFLDYHAGEVPTPPRWMSRIGLEWLCRLAMEPRRLFARYLVEPWTLLPVFTRELIGRSRPD